MEKTVILEKIHIALDTLISNDSYLLENDLNERTITHKLAEYLQPLFLGYNVDCEYNRNYSNPESKKRILYKYEKLTDDLIRKMRLKEEDKKEIMDCLVYPDIIIHKRGSKTNLCIIETKKSSNKYPIEFDEIKLGAYTDGILGNDLRYDFGVFIKFNIRDYNKPRFFVNGVDVTEQDNSVN